MCTGEQADACVECLKWDIPKDKWSCHVCMDQVDKDMVARNECYQCLKVGSCPTYYAYACMQLYVRAWGGGFAGVAIDLLGASPS
jgi:hypothetical protein